MTMISGYKLKEGGFLVADILLTTRSKSLPVSQVPSFTSDEDESASSEYAVAGLCQKILVVNDHFAVAFAGDVAAIQDVVRLIDELVEQDPVLTGKRFSEAVTSDPYISNQKIKIISLSVEGDKLDVSNVYAEFGHANEHFELWVGGSGEEHAIEHYQDYPAHAFDVPEEDIVVHGTCMALDQFAKHLKNEFENKFTSESIANLFGGGYEVVAFHGGRFQKISNIVYAFADAEIDSNGILQVDFPKCLIKSEYDGEDLKIRSVELEFDEDSDDFTATKDRTFTIAPIARYTQTKVDENVDDVKFKGEFLCFLINVKAPKGNFTIPYIYKYESDMHFVVQAFAAVVRPGFVHLHYSELFSENITAHILAFMEQLKASVVVVY